MCFPPKAMNELPVEQPLIELFGSEFGSESAETFSDVTCKGYVPW